MSDTPRTDGFGKIRYGGQDYVDIEDCRELERELIEAQQEIERLKERLEIDAHHSVDGIEARDETILLLENELLEERKDAERYRWLTLLHQETSDDIYDLLGAVPKEHSDDAIDAAIAVGK